MVGSRGKRSGLKLKGLAPEPVGHEPLTINFDESSDGPLDGKEGKIDATLNTQVISLEEQMDVVIAGSFLSDGHEENKENDPDAHEVNDREKDVGTEISVDRNEDVCSQGGTMEDVNGVIYGSDAIHAAADVSVEDNEERTIKQMPEEDEAPAKFGLDNNDAATDERKSSEVTTEVVPTNDEGLASSDHGIIDYMTVDQENPIEPSELDMDVPIDTLSDRREEHIIENTTTANEVAGQVKRPKRKIGKKKVVKKKIVVRKSKEDKARKNEKKPEEDEEQVNFGLRSNDDDTVGERKSPDVTTEGVPTSNEGLASPDSEMMQTMTDSLENHEEPSKLDVEEPIGTLPDRGGEEQVKEDANITNEVKELTEQANRPKRKVVKKKVVKKKMVPKHAGAVNGGVSQPFDENNTSGAACKVDTNEHVNCEDPSDEACKVDENKHVNNKEEAEVKPPVKVNKKRKNIRKIKGLQSHTGVATAKDAHISQSGNDEPRNEEATDVNEPEVKNDKVEKSGDRVSLLKKGKKKLVAKKGSLEGVSKNKPKQPKRIDSMGMIFMCSTETKKDCYRYKIFGLPAGKKDMVSKIYQGMRLFLFDVDLRMLYGIYKAAAPGGYNIEPRAFKSQYPSQVRFSVFEDCVPLAEERFKKVLKDNYYTKNKFNCQLNSVQVKSLCKLFSEASRKADSQKASGSRRPAAPNSSARRDKKRPRVEDSRRGVAAPVERERSRRRTLEERRHAPVVIDDRSRRRSQVEIRHVPVVLDDRSWRREQEELRHAPVVIDDRSRRRAQEERRHAPVVLDDRGRIRAQEELRHAPVVLDDRGQIRAQEEVRHAPVVLDDRYHRQPVYERETYLSSVAPASSYMALPAHSPSRTRMYSFDRSLGIDSYRRDSVLDHQELSLSSSREPRLPIGLSHHDPYVSYTEPLVYSGSAYSTDTRREHYDYTSDGRYAEYYRPAEHRPPPPLYRRY